MYIVMIAAWREIYNIVMIAAWREIRLLKLPGNFLDSHGPAGRSCYTIVVSLPLFIHLGCHKAAILQDIS